MKPKLYAKIALLCCSPAFFSGCGIDSYLKRTDYVDITSPDTLTDREKIEQIDLTELLKNFAPSITADTKECLKEGDNAQPLSQIKSVDNAFKYFTCVVQQNTDSVQRSSRNSLQERLLGASVQRCGAFKANLQREFSRTNFTLGILSTITGTAGALVTGGNDANILSGLSAISSGTRAQYNQDYMANLAAYVIVDGIDLRRRDVYKQIQKNGQSKSYADYPVEAAVGCALLSRIM